jgi:chromosome segregation and condensation protein ScpB
VTRAQLATLAGMKARGGAYGTYLSALRLNGYLAENGKLVGISAAGLAETGTDAGEPVTLEEVRERWRGVLKAGARAMLDELLGCYPASRTRAELAAAAGMEQRGGAFGTYLSNLRTNGLIEEGGDGIRAADVFFLTEGSTR